MEMRKRIGKEVSPEEAVICGIALNLPYMTTSEYASSVNSRVYITGEGGTISADQLQRHRTVLRGRTGLAGEKNRTAHCPAGERWSFFTPPAIASLVVTLRLSYRPGNGSRPEHSMNFSSLVTLCWRSHSARKCGASTAAGGCGGLSPTPERTLETNVATIGGGPHLSFYHAPRASGEATSTPSARSTLWP